MDEEREDKDQQAIEDWCKSFGIMRVIINRAVVWAGLQIIVSKIPAWDYESV